MLPIFVVLMPLTGTKITHKPVVKTGNLYLPKSD
jgi:hypothetical protein